MVTWSKKTGKDGSLTLREGSRWIHVHRSMGKYWVDAGRVDTHTKDTYAPARTMKEAMKRVEDAKYNFRLESTGKKAIHERIHRLKRRHLREVGL